MSKLLMQIRLAVRYLAGRKFRTGLTTLAVLFGVMIIFGLNGILPSVVQTFRQSMLAATGQVDLSVTNVAGAPFSPAVADRVAAVPGISAVSPTIRRTLTMPKSSPVARFTVVGVEPSAAEGVRGFPLADGRFLATGDGDTIAMAEDLARQLKVRPGDTVELPTVDGLRPYEVVGLLRLPVIPGSEEVYVPLSAAQRLFGMDGRINAVDAAFAPDADRESVENEVISELGPSFTIKALDNTQLLASLRLGQVMMNLFGVFALAMGGFIILNTFRTVVSERRRDIGMLRAVGASRKTILGMFLTESLIQGALGTALGLLGGWGLAVGLLGVVNPIYEKLLNARIAPPQFSTATWIAAIALGMGVTVLGALLPALSASRITPLDALRPQMGDVVEKAATRRAWVGLVLVGLAIAGLVSGVSRLVGLSAVLFLVALVLVAPVIVRPVTNVFTRLLRFAFAREGEVARANLQRNPGRAAVTASTMMVSIAIVVALLGMVTSIFDGFIGYVEKSLGADFVVIPNNLILSLGNTGISPEAIERIRGTEGVGDVATLRLSGAQVDGATLQIIGINPKEYPKVASFEYSKGTSQADLRKLGRGRQLMVNGVFAAQNAIETGDRLKLQTPTGERTYRVAGIATDYLNAKLATAYVSQANLDRDFNGAADVAVLANMTPGADGETVRAGLESLLAAYPQFRLYDAASFVAEQQTTFRSSISMLYILVFALGFPSLLALLNTLAIGVLARTREIGMLRAVGGLRRQIRRMVLGESLLLAALGTGLGILAGIWLGYVFTLQLNSFGFEIPYYFPVGGVLAALAVGLVFGVIAALIPARQAAKLRVVDALRYE